MSLAHFALTLVTLSLHRNKLTECVLSTEFPVHKELNLSNNQIQAISIASNTMAPSLTTLNFSCNRLKEIQSELTDKLPGLTTLFAYTNKITNTGPESFQGVRVLDLGKSDIALVPPMLCRVMSIKELNLDGNWSVEWKATSSKYRRVFVY